VHARIFIRQRAHAQKHSVSAHERAHARAQAAKCLFDVALGNGESAGVPLPDILLVCLFQVTPASLRSPCQPFFLHLRVAHLRRGRPSVIWLVPPLPRLMGGCVRQVIGSLLGALVAFELLVPAATAAVAIIAGGRAVDKAKAD
jgi:hypothetical protein